MNGFQLHNIQHSSPSSINTWASAPDVWVAEKLFGLKSKPGAAAYRGIAIEKAVVNHLSNGIVLEDAIAEAVSFYNSQTSMMLGDSVDKERAAIDGCVRQAVEVLLPYGKPSFPEDGSQNKIELLCRGDGWDLPLIGYLDLVYPDHGLIVDLKTTLKAPSEMSLAHQRQCAVYRRASGNSEVRFLYVTPKKFSWLECPDVTGTLAEIKQILTRQERFLRAGDRDVLKDLVHVQPDSFYWNGVEATMNRKKLYGV